MVSHSQLKRKRSNTCKAMATALLGIGAAAAVSHLALQKAKKDLARYLAEAMGEYLEVDPAQVQSALLSSKARLVLNDVRIRPVDVDVAGIGTVRQEGAVDRVEFAWKWGGSKDGSTAFVRDARLTVSGARILLTVPHALHVPVLPAHVDRREENVEVDIDGCISPSEHEETLSCAQDTEGTEPGPADQATSGHLQQILDHLTLRIMDLNVEVRVGAQDRGGGDDDDDDDSHGIAFEAEALELVSLGRCGNASDHGGGTGTAAAVRSDNGEPWEQGEEPLPPPLVQTISIEKVCAYLVGSGRNAQQKGGRKYLLEPFGYSADVKRVAGQRFSGLDFGLDIVGSMMPVPGQEDSDPVVTIHAGTSQIEALLRIYNALSTNACHLDKGATPEAPTSKEDVTPYSTSFVLHLPSVVLVLPNGATIQTFFWRLCQHADGSVNTLQAKGAVTVNATHAFVLLEEGKCFYADLTRNKIVLRSLIEQETEAESLTQVQAQVHRLAKVTWEESEMAKVLEGVRQVALLVDPDYCAEKRDHTASIEPKSSPEAPSMKQPPWSFETEKGGTISFRVESRTSEGTQWAEASLDSPAVVLPDRPDELPEQVSFSGATLGPTSFGDISVRMESMELKTDKFKRANVSDMQLFINRALGMGSW